MNSCFSLIREKNTEEVIPAKHVIDAVLTLQKKEVVFSEIYKNKKRNLLDIRRISQTKDGQILIIWLQWSGLNKGFICLIIIKETSHTMKNCDIP